MLNLYRGSTTLYYCALFGGIILLVWLLLQFSDNNTSINPKTILTLLTVITLFAWIFLDLMYSTRLALRIQKNLNKLLMEECNAKVFLTRNHKLLRNKDGLLRKFAYYINKANGHVCLGEWEQANEALSQIKDFPSQYKPYWQALYSITFATYYLGTEQLENASAALDDMKKALNMREDKHFSYDVLITGYFEKRLILRVKEGQLEGALESFRDMLDCAQTKLRKVTLSYHMAQTLLLLNKPYEAEKAYQYVADNGGDTYYATKAREFLASEG